VCWKQPRSLLLWMIQQNTQFTVSVYLTCALCLCLSRLCFGFVLFLRFFSFHDEQMIAKYESSFGGCGSDKPYTTTNKRKTFGLVPMETMGKTTTESVVSNDTTKQTAPIFLCFSCGCWLCGVLASARPRRRRLHERHNENHASFLSEINK
jgi:hypothetical protein